MGVWDVLIIPFLLGLLGFFEPCSLGANSIFLAHTRKLGKAAKLGEALLFLLVRAAVLSLLGLSIAFIGKQLFTFQASYFVILGVFYAMLGAAHVYAQHKGIALPTLNILPRVHKANIVVMAIVFGMVIPACAIPLLLALLGRTLLVGELLNGWLSLFSFGIALSVPLTFLAMSERAHVILAALRNKTARIPYLAGILLILLGILTALSSVWWINGA